MPLKKKKARKKDLYTDAVQQHLELSVRDKEACLEFLINVFNHIRPDSLHSAEKANANLQLLMAQLDASPTLLQNLRIAVMAQLINTNLVPALTESGVLLSRGFVQEFVTRLNHKFLPALQDESDFLYTINRIFFRKTDYLWVEAIKRENWKVFFEKLGLSISQQNQQLRQQLLQSLIILSYKVAHLGLEPEVCQYIDGRAPEQNPFVVQNHRINQVQTRYELGLTNDTLPDIGKLHALVEACLDSLHGIREIQAVKGASLSLSYITLVMENCLRRMLILVDALDEDQRFNTDSLVDFFRLLVRNEKRKNSIRGLFAQSFGYIAYQIAEHKGSKGNKYITTTRKEYYRMIGSAMWGGFIISFIAVFKNLLGKLHLPPFWQGVAYSVNYSIGFLAIEETHSTLATKQPAFTASAVAGSLDTRKNEQPNLYNLAITVARVTRSQYASFLGNLVVVFPVTYAFAWLYHLATGHKLAEGEQAMHLLREQHPWQSFSLLYACNTGVFLFLSGLIAGFIQNKIQYGRVADRLQKHPLLNITVPQRRLQKMAAYIEGHTGSIVGNIALGFFLGMSTVIVKIFGIPFDIRHITISAGNVAIGTYGVGFDHLPWQYLCMVLLGVAGIGFLNFLVSFSLAFTVAVKSRGILLRDYPEFIKILWRYWKKYPLDFIRPRKQLSQAENG
jgi:site-specific recombinase